jgi:hypothetical protein
LKALEENIKARQARAMPQRKQRSFQMADLVGIALLIGLMMTSSMPPADLDYETKVNEGNRERFQNLQKNNDAR